MELETKTEIITITDHALSQVKDIIDQQDKEDLFLRVFVQGGCGGINYGIAIDMNQMSDDHELFFDGLKVIIDKLSYPNVEGATIDYDTSGEKSGFRITNPKAAEMMSQAACGPSGCGPNGC